MSEREQVIAELLYLKRDCLEGSATDQTIDKAIALLEAEEPVVRCAECRHCFDLGGDPMEPYDGESEWYCDRWDTETSARWKDPYKFFCADGERRET